VDVSTSPIGVRFLSLWFVPHVINMPIVKLRPLSMIRVKAHPSHSKTGKHIKVRGFLRKSGRRPLDVTYWQDRGYTHSAAISAANAALRRRAMRGAATRKVQRRNRRAGMRRV